MAIKNRPFPASSSRRHLRRVLLVLAHWTDSIHVGVANYATSAGWILNAGMRYGGMFPSDWRGDGVIAFAGGDEKTQGQTLAFGLPLVSMDPLWRPRGAGQVLGDDVLIGRLAGEHFADRGFRDVGVVGYDARGGYESAMLDARLSGLRRVAEARGMAVHVVPASSSLERRLPELPTPIGLLAASDGAAVDLIDRCEACGLMVPEQVAVLGVDDEAIVCDLAPVPISSINNDFERKGYEAARMLDRIMAGEPPPEEPLVVPSRGVTLRQSTNILAVNDPRVVRALGFIMAHFQESITVGQVVDAAQCSQRRLQDLFLQHLNRGMLAELTRLRVSHACALLRDTDLKVNAIAAESGFSSRHHLTGAMKRLTGSTPRAYRNRPPHSNRQKKRSDPER